MQAEELYFYIYFFTNNSCINIRNSLLSQSTPDFTWKCHVNSPFLWLLFPSVHSSSGKTVDGRTSTKLNGHGRESTPTLMRPRAARKITSAVGRRLNFLHSRTFWGYVFFKLKIVRERRISLNYIIYAYYISFITRYESLNYQNCLMIITNCVPSV